MPSSHLHGLPNRHGPNVIVGKELGRLGHGTVEIDRAKEAISAQQKFVRRPGIRHDPQYSLVPRGELRRQRLRFPGPFRERPRLHVVDLDPVVRPRHRETEGRFLSGGQEGEAGRGHRGSGHRPEVDEGVVRRGTSKEVRRGRGRREGAGGGRQDVACGGDVEEGDGEGGGVVGEGKALGQTERGGGVITVEVEGEDHDGAGAAAVDLVGSFDVEYFEGGDLRQVPVGRGVVPGFGSDGRGDDGVVLVLDEDEDGQTRHICQTEDFSIIGKGRAGDIERRFALNDSCRLSFFYSGRFFVFWLGRGWFVW
mmetsp:Transcript_18374/g.42056  ORF Transcript_18374/g.42056 Transcript_18374/m.42056 type:complete len:309 (-) Transcript_18374:2232-3158(-)